MLAYILTSWLGWTDNRDLGWLVKWRWLESSPVSCVVYLLELLSDTECPSIWVNISIAHILGFFHHFLSILFQFFFFFKHVVDEFWKTNPRLVLQETPPPRSLEVFCPFRWNFCPLRWNFCPLWRNYRTLWWNHDVIPCIMAPHSMDCGNVEVGSLKGWILLKVPIILKNALDKSSLKLNFLKKKQWTHISISPIGGTRGVQRLAFPL